MRHLARLAFLALLPLAGDAQAQQPAATPEPRTISVTAKRFEFSPATITLKKGETVNLVVTSQDVTHGLFLRKLKIDLDLPAGEARTVTVTPQEAGTFAAICHHFCGSGHGNMKLRVVVVDPDAPPDPASSGGR